MGSQLKTFHIFLLLSSQIMGTLKCRFFAPVDTGQIQQLLLLRFIYGLGRFQLITQEDKMSSQHHNAKKHFIFILCFTKPMISSLYVPGSNLNSWRPISSTTPAPVWQIQPLRLRGRSWTGSPGPWERAEPWRSHHSRLLRSPMKNEAFHETLIIWT
jgi:hypothetical protein